MLFHSEPSETSVPTTLYVVSAFFSDKAENDTTYLNMSLLFRRTLESCLDVVKIHEMQTFYDGLPFLQSYLGLRQ